MQNVEWPLGSFFSPINASDVTAVQSKIEPINASIISPINLVNNARKGLLENKEFLAI